MSKSRKKETDYQELFNSWFKDYVMSQREFAEHAGITLKTLQDTLSGKSCPHPKTIKKVAENLGCYSVDDFLKGPEHCKEQWEQEKREIEAEGGKTIQDQILFEAFNASFESFWDKIWEDQELLKEIAFFHFLQLPNEERKEIARQYYIKSTINDFNNYP